MLVELFIMEDNGAYVGETSAITIRSNNADINGTPVEFWGNTRASVVEQVIAQLKARGLTGKLRIL
jgi:hypothetical protein